MTAAAHTTAPTREPARRAAPPAGVPANARVTFWRELRAEWIKLFAVRSTPWIVAVTVVVMAGITALGAWGTSQLISNPDLAGGPGGDAGFGALDPSLGVGIATSGYVLGQIVVAILGVMIISGEYSTGQIRSSLAAVPSRLPVLGAKAVVVTVVSLVTGLVAVALSSVLTLPFLSDQGAAVDLSFENTVQQLLGVPLYLAAVALLALGVGTMLRHTAAGIAVAVVLFFVLPLIWPSIPLDFFTDTSPYLPSIAGGELIAGPTDGAELSPWQGYGVMAAWSAAALVGAAVLLRRRDA